MEFHGAAFSGLGPAIASRSALPRLAHCPATRKPVHVTTRPVRRATVVAAAPALPAVSAKFAKVATLVYCAIITVGGISARAKSKPSFISAIVSAAFLALAYYKESVPLALGVAALLTVVFTIRFIKTKKLNPSGILGTASAIATAIFALAVRGG